MIKILEDDELDDELFYEDGTPYKKEEIKEKEVKIEGFKELIGINKQLLLEMKELNKPKPRRSWVAVPTRKDGQIIKVNIQEN